MSDSHTSIRNRACGIVVNEGKLALIQLHSPLTKRLIWMPPGGGVLEGESLTDCVEREVLEECEIRVRAQQLMYVTELILPKAHVLEFYFRCEYLGGELRLGEDPERSERILKAAKWLPVSELKTQESLHPAFLRERLANDLTSNNQQASFFKTAATIHQ